MSNFLICLFYLHVVRNDRLSSIFFTLFCGGRCVEAFATFVTAAFFIEVDVHSDFCDVHANLASGHIKSKMSF